MMYHHFSNRVHSQFMNIYTKFDGFIWHKTIIDRIEKATNESTYILGL